MIDINEPIELVNPVTGEVKPAQKVTGPWLDSAGSFIGIDVLYDYYNQYRLDTGKSVLGDDSKNPCYIRNKVDVNLVKLINDAGWCIASLGQDDNFKWSYEIREGYLTSYTMVFSGTKYDTMNNALSAAFTKITNFNKLKATAKDLGISGKVVF